MNLNYPFSFPLTALPTISVLWSCLARTYYRFFTLPTWDLQPKIFVSGLICASPTPYFLNLSGFIVRYRQKIVRLPADAFLVAKATNLLLPYLGSVKTLQVLGCLFLIFLKCLTIKDLVICVLEHVYLSVHPEYALALQRFNKAHVVQRRRVEGIPERCLSSPA